MRFLKVYSLLLGFIICLPAQAGWILDKSSSHLYFTFTKNTHLATTATFSDISGYIDDKKSASLTINLASISSGIEKRDSRLKDLFFDVAKTPTAEVSLSIFNRLKKQVKEDQDVILDLGFYLKLNGIQKRLKAPVLVRKNKDNEIELTTLEPIIVMANEFGLEEKVKLLVTIAGVNNISYAVPVTFRLKFIPE